ncbi:MAG: hypothetical protein ACM3X4_01600 [Ignavibacteriales bacterium]
MEECEVILFNVEDPQGVSEFVERYLHYMCEGLIQDAATDLSEKFQREDDDDETNDLIADAVERGFAEGVAAGIALATDLGPAAQHIRTYAIGRRKEHLYYQEIGYQKMLTKKIEGATTD